MSDILEVAVVVDTLELAFDDGLELFIAEDNIELIVQDDTELTLQNDTIEILTLAEQIPGTSGAKIFFGPTPPLNASVNDLWVKTA